MKNIYKVYIDKCKEIKEEPKVEKKELEHLWNKTTEVLMHMYGQGKNEPYIVVDIDGKLSLYEEINKENIVTNIWTKDQVYYLLGGSRCPKKSTKEQ